MNMSSTTRAGLVMIGGALVIAIGVWADAAWPAIAIGGSVLLVGILLLPRIE